MENIGKVLDTARKSAPNNRDFGHNRDRKEQQRRSDGYMQKLDGTHSKMYTNNFTKIEYLNVKLLRPASYAALFCLSAETVRTELIKLGYQLGSTHIDPLTTIVSGNLSDTFTVGVLSGVLVFNLLTSGIGWSKFGKDGYVAAIRNSKRDSSKLNFTV